jgi:hypothetical protein
MELFTAGLVANVIKLFWHDFHRFRRIVFLSFDWGYTAREVYYLEIFYNIGTMGPRQYFKPSLIFVNKEGLLALNSQR